MTLRDGYILLAILFWAAAFSGCSGLEDNEGGFEAGNPPASRPTRTLIGEVDGNDASSSEAQWEGTYGHMRYAGAAENCVADTVIATDSGATSTEAEIAEDCTFAIEVAVDEAYVLQFELTGAFVAALSFTTDSSEVEVTTVYVSEADTPLDFGKIVFSNGKASPENDPLAQNDADDDGVSDAEDEDDNNDGTSDVDEEDCDLDGIADVFDQDLDVCADVSDAADDATDTVDDGADTTGDVADDTETGSPAESGEGADEGAVEAAQILEVLPRLNAGLDGINAAAATTTAIQFRTGCAIAAASVSEENFSVTDELGNAVSCAYSLSASQETVSCVPVSSLTPLLVYTATVSGVDCEDGAVVETLDWSWLVAQPALF